MSDDRIFRMTRARGVVEYGNRRSLKARLSSPQEPYNKGRIVKVEAASAEATSGWSDVTREFQEATS